MGHKNSKYNNNKNEKNFSSNNINKHKKTNKIFKKIINPNNNIIDNNLIIDNNIDGNYLQTDFNFNNTAYDINYNNIIKSDEENVDNINNISNYNTININNEINKNNNNINNNTYYNNTIKTQRTLVHSKSTLINKYFPIKNKINIEKTFEQKVESFRVKIKPYKLDFTEGACFLKVNREDIIKSSMTGIKKLDLRKELKIDFIGEICQDAGGLIREWLTVLFKEILDPKQDLFERADNDEISYIFSQKEITKQKKEIYEFIGIVLAKALLENLTINCCFNTLIYKILLQEEIKLEDLVFIDKQLYKSLKEIKEISLMGDISLYELYFNLDIEKDGKMISYNLIENGENIQVTNKNILKFLRKTNHFNCKIKISIFINIYTF